VNYFTDSLVKTDIKPLTEDERFGYAGEGSPRAEAVLGTSWSAARPRNSRRSVSTPTRTSATVKSTCAEEETQTRALAFLFPQETEAGRVLAAMDEAGAAAALGGFASLIRRIAPMYLLCDSRDLGVAERTRDPHFGVPAVYVFDRYPGGTGLSEALARRADDLFAAAFGAVRSCPCGGGCPSCVGAADESASDPGEGLSVKRAAEALLAALAGGKIG
jgi:DEAD/DEAH box helicase domain-containing protein